MNDIRLIIKKTEYSYERFCKDDTCCDCRTFPFRIRSNVYDDCYGKIVSKYIQQREYKKALDAYEKLTTYDENSIGYKSMVYGLAEKYFEDGEYVSAAGYFGKILLYLLPKHYL